MDGLLVIDKPSGMTSFDVVARLRRALGTRKVGHAGTLDPMAQGVLIVALGEATKLVPYMLHKKVYDACISLGRETTTLDREGTTLEEVPVPVEVLRALCESPTIMDKNSLVMRALEEERARTSQVPPQVSAIHVNGVRAHELVRQGKTVELAPREVHVHDLRNHRWDATPPRLWLTVEVGAGYYVRSLARDLGRTLGTRGTLETLRRTQSGPFAIAEAVPLDSPRDTLVAHVLSVAAAVKRLMPCLCLSEVDVVHARAGRMFLQEVNEKPQAWFDAAGTLIAIGSTNAEGEARVLRGFM